MRDLTKAETEEFEEAIRCRALEMKEEKMAAEYVVTEKDDDDDDEVEEGETTDAAAGGGAATSGDGSVEEPEEPQPSTTGSRGVELGGDSEYFYSQFELTTRSRKIIQIVSVCARQWMAAGGNFFLSYV